jgi:apolipoprotein N-acyltransferase
MALAILSGILTAAAFPPIDQPWLAWIALIPLFVGLLKSRDPRRAAASGAMAGLVFGLIVLGPIRSADLWTGWAAMPLESIDAARDRQARFLGSLWIAASLWMAVFWGIFSFCLVRVASDRRGLIALAAPCLWVLIPEYLRACASGGFHWAMLGNAAATATPIRQLASIGGVWLISALVVGVNAVFAILLLTPRRRRSWLAALGAVALVTAAVLWGQWRQRSVAAGSPTVGVVALQSGSIDPSAARVADLGLDPGILTTIETTMQSLKGRFDLIVLPESLGISALTLDSTIAAGRPRGLQAPIEVWESVFGDLLDEPGTVLVLGADTVERGQLHNSMVAFTSLGVVGWYHKRRLVPFAERTPRLWPRGARGKLQYTPGREPRVISIGGLALGAVICHEVLFPNLTRATVRSGASILVSGGNDDVFANPAVAEINARAAQLRAAETGRFLIRVMKTGVTGIIDPAGAEVARSQTSQPTAILARVEPSEHLTLYARFGDWVVIAAAAGALALLLLAHWGRPSNGPHGSRTFSS